MKHLHCEFISILFVHLVLGFLACQLCLGEKKRGKTKPKIAAFKDNFADDKNEAWNLVFVVHTTN